MFLIGTRNHMTKLHETVSGDASDTCDTTIRANAANLSRRRRWVIRIRRVLVILTFFALLPTCAHAIFGLSWESGLGAVVAIVGIGILYTVTAPISIPVTAAGIVVTAVGLAMVGDDIIESRKRTASAPAPPPIVQPRVLADPVLPTYALATPLPTTLNNIPSTGTSADSVIADGNRVINAINDLAGSTPDINTDFGKLSSGLNDLAKDYAALVPPSGFDLTFTQASLDAELSKIGTSGLPPDLTAALMNIGYDSAQIDALSTYLSQSTLNLATSSVTGSDILAASADAVEASAIPEPSTFLMLGTGLTGILSYGWRGRRQT